MWARERRQPPTAAPASEAATEAKPLPQQPQAVAHSSQPQRHNGNHSRGKTPETGNQPQQGVAPLPLPPPPLLQRIRTHQYKCPHSVTTGSDAMSKHTLQSKVPPSSAGAAADGAEAAGFGAEAAGVAAAGGLTAAPLPTPPLKAVPPATRRLNPPSDASMAHSAWDVHVNTHGTATRQTQLTHSLTHTRVHFNTPEAYTPTTTKPNTALSKTPKTTLTRRQIKHCLRGSTSVSRS